MNSIKQWEVFYREAFGTIVDFSGVKIPERTEEQRSDFTCLLVIAGALKLNYIYSVCSGYFPCYRYISDLDTFICVNERKTEKETYAIWVRDTVEADCIHKNKSAKMVELGKVKTETLLERTLQELMCHLETGKRLDISNQTLCSGSRDSSGHVPLAYCYDGEFRVSWDTADGKNDRLRSREVISIV